VRTDESSYELEQSKISQETLINCSGSSFEEESFLVDIERYNK